MSDKYELMGPDDYESLPEDPEEAFAEVDRICMNKMGTLISENSSQDFDELIRTNYVSTMIGLAYECGLSSVIDAEPDHYNYDTFQKFSIAVKKETARIRFKNRGRSKRNSVLLTESTKTKLRHYVDRLRSTIEKSDFPDEKKNSLLNSLLKFEEEINKHRFDYSIGFAVMVSIIPIFSSVVTVFADGGTAITNIFHLIGKDIETESQATQRLNPPVKALPPPEKQKNEKSSQENTIDDEIPF